MRAAVFFMLLIQTLAMRDTKGLLGGVYFLKEVEE